MDTVKMSLEDFSNYVEDENPELAIARCCFLSTRPNSHKLNITEEMLRRDAKTILGKWIIGNLNWSETDVEGHETTPQIFGYIPENQDIEFVEKDGYLLAYIKAVISKIYANKVYDIFTRDNFRNTSVEMMTREDEDGNLVGFNICGLTILAKTINGSCPDANMQIVRFSEEDAEKYERYLSSALGKSKIEKMEQLTKMAKRYKIDKSAKGLSNDDWSNVDKTTLRNTILDAQNKAELVKAVYLKVEDGWEEAPSEKLGYPVMQLKGETFVYNRNALANAKARAVQQNETEVLSKLNKIYEKLKLDDGKEEKMSDPKQEDKDVVMGCGGSEDKLEKKAQEGEEKKEEKMETTPEEKKLEDAKDAPKGEEEEKKDEEEKDDSEDKEKMAQLLAEKDAKIKEQEDKLSEQEKKLEELTKFKADIEEKEKMSVVSQTLAKIKEHVSEEDYAKFEEKGKACKFEEVTSWRNEVLANVTEVLMSAEKKENHLRMSVVTENKETSLWNRL